MHSKNQATAKKSFTKNLPNEHKYKVVNSCNGFICMSEPIIGDPLIVCNPITGEFILLLEASRHPKNIKKGSDMCGFGFSLKTNLYKVIRILEGTPDPNRVAEVHTLGTWFMGMC